LNPFLMSRTWPHRVPWRNAATCRWR